MQISQSLAFQIFTSKVNQDFVCNQKKYLVLNYSGPIKLSIGFYAIKEFTVNNKNFYLKIYFPPCGKPNIEIKNSFQAFQYTIVLDAEEIT